MRRINNSTGISNGNNTAGRAPAHNNARTQHAYVTLDDELHQ
jgi:hypothetical protein